MNAESQSVSIFIEKSLNTGEGKVLSPAERKQDKVNGTFTRRLHVREGGQSVITEHFKGFGRSLLSAKSLPTKNSCMWKREKQCSGVLASEGPHLRGRQPAMANRERSTVPTVASSSRSLLAARINDEVETSSADADATATTNDHSRVTLAVEKQKIVSHRNLPVKFGRQGESRTRRSAAEANFPASQSTSEILSSFFVNQNSSQSSTAKGRQQTQLPAATDADSPIVRVATKNAAAQKGCRGGSICLNSQPATDNEVPTSEKTSPLDEPLTGTLAVHATSAAGEFQMRNSNVSIRTDPTSTRQVSPSQTASEDLYTRGEALQRRRDKTSAHCGAITSTQSLESTLYSGVSRAIPGLKSVLSCIHSPEGAATLVRPSVKPNFSAASRLSAFTLEDTGLHLRSPGKVGKIFQVSNLFSQLPANRVSVNQRIPTSPLGSSAREHTRLSQQSSVANDPSFPSYPVRTANAILVPRSRNLAVKSSLDTLGRKNQPNASAVPNRSFARLAAERSARRVVQRSSHCNVTAARDCSKGESRMVDQSHRTDIKRLSIFAPPSNFSRASKRTSSALRPESQSFVPDPCQLSILTLTLPVLCNRLRRKTLKQSHTHVSDSSNAMRCSADLPTSLPEEGGMRQYSENARGLGPSVEVGTTEMRTNDVECDQHVPTRHSRINAFAEEQAFLGSEGITGESSFSDAVQTSHGELPKHSKGNPADVDVAEVARAEYITELAKGLPAQPADAAASKTFLKALEKHSDVEQVAAENLERDWGPVYTKTAFTIAEDARDGATVVAPDRFRTTTVYMQRFPVGELAEGKSTASLEIVTGKICAQAPGTLEKAANCRKDKKAIACAAKAVETQNLTNKPEELSNEAAPETANVGHAVNVAEAIAKDSSRYIDLEGTATGLDCRPGPESLNIITVEDLEERCLERFFQALEVPPSVTESARKWCAGKTNIYGSVRKRCYDQPFAVPRRPEWVERLRQDKRKLRPFCRWISHCLGIGDTRTCNQVKRRGRRPSVAQGHSPLNTFGYPAYDARSGKVYLQKRAPLSIIHGKMVPIKVGAEDYVIQGTFDQISAFLDCFSEYEVYAAKLLPNSRWSFDPLQGPLYLQIENSVKNLSFPTSTRRLMGRLILEWPLIALSSVGTLFNVGLLRGYKEAATLADNIERLWNLFPGFTRADMFEFWNRIVATQTMKGRRTLVQQFFKSASAHFKLERSKGWIDASTVDLTRRLTLFFTSYPRQSHGMRATLAMQSNRVTLADVRNAFPGIQRLPSKLYSTLQDAALIDV